MFDPLRSPRHGQPSSPSGATKPPSEPIIDPVADPILDPAAVPTEIAVQAAVEAAELIAEVSAETEAEERARRLRLFAFDVDGTLTDGTIWIGAHGEVMKGFCVRDGYGLAMLKRAGWKLAIITARKSEIVERRAAELGFDLVLQGMHDKAAALEQTCAQLQVRLEQAGYIGDDWPDLPAMRAAGFAATLPDAPGVLRDVAHWVSTAPAGRGAVRELCEWLLRARGEWPHEQ